MSESIKFKEALGQACEEFKSLYQKDMKFLKKTEDRVAAVKMAMMRARDIERERGVTQYPQFVFHLCTYDFENMTFIKCPGCGNPDILQESNGVKWKGCYKCRVLLDDKKALITAMKPPGAKPTPKPEGEM